jgi:DNA-binding response OmpR family regulator
MQRILLIEDSHDIADLVTLHLGDMGCKVIWARDGHSGFRLAKSEDFDLIILDLMLPGMQGREICRRLRTEGDFTPILMLTAKSSEQDRVAGLELGADDYLTKPFGMAELCARVKAILRRLDRAAWSDGMQDKIRAGSMTITPEARSVTVGDREVELTAKEFDLLLHFATHPGRVYSRAQLLDQIWGHGHAGYEHTVNSHINRLRAKIEDDPANPIFVLTVWGVGYKFNEMLETGKETR